MLSRLEGRSWALGIVALAGAVMLTRYAFDCFTPPPPETAGSGRAPHSLGRGVVANFLNPHPYLFWLTVGMEDVRGLFWRVAAAIAGEEAKYDKSPFTVEDLARRFYGLMTDGRFLPNSPPS